MNFTLTRSGDTIVSKDINILLECLMKDDRFDSDSFIVLFGSYGKGEGAIVNGKPTNDYDVLVITDSGDMNSDWMREVIEDKVSNHVDFIVTSESDLNEQPITQQYFEYAAGTVIYAPKGKKFPIRIIEPYEISYTDAINSINRRIVSLLVGKHEMMKEHPDYRKVAEQIVKAIIAVGDATLIRRGEFHHSYFVRSTMLVTDPVGDMYQTAVAIKCLGKPVLNPDQLWSLWNSTKHMVREYCMENSIGGVYLDALLAVTDDIKHEDLAEVLKQFGAEEWL